MAPLSALIEAGRVTRKWMSSQSMSDGLAAMAASGLTAPDDGFWSDRTCIANRLRRWLMKPSFPPVWLQVTSPL